jgi:polysaccharide pyruvyl transferase CsaB
MRVLHLIGGGDVGGAKTHIYSLLGRLTSRPGVDVLLVPLRYGPFAEEAAGLGIPTRVLPGSIRSALKELRRLLAEGNYEILHCHGARANLCGALLKLRGFAPPVITTVHSDPRLDYLGRPFARCTFGALNAWALRRLDAYIGVSDPVTDLLTKRGFPPDKLYTIYNGLEMPIGAAICRPHNDTVTAGIAARFDKVKDHATLLKAFAAADLPNLRLKLAGVGPERRRLERLCDTLSIRDRVEFLGWVGAGDMPAFFASLDINLITSKYETFPYALTEGARAACATIASRVGGIPKLIDTEVSGLLFKPGDADSLARCLTRLYRDPGLRERLGRSLFAKTARSFSLDKTADTQLDIYRRVLAPKKPGFLACGAYGKDNLGDDAMLTVLRGAMAGAFPERRLTVLSRKPANTRRRFRVRTRHTFNLFGFWREARRCEVFFHGGGNLLQDETSSRSLWFYLLTLWLAKKCGCKVLMIGCGIGGLRKPGNRRLTARIVASCVDGIALREADSLQELESLGIPVGRGVYDAPQVTLAADLALTLPPADSDAADSYLLTQGLSPDGAYLCLALRPWPGFEEQLPDFAAFCEAAHLKHGLTPVFLAIEPHRDTGPACAVAARLSCPHHILAPIGDPALAAAVLGKMRALAAMRLHALVLTAGSGVPLIGISYGEKVTAFLDAMGCRACVPLRQANQDTLVSLLDAALTEDASVRLLRANELKQAAAGNIDLIRAVLE